MPKVCKLHRKFVGMKAESLRNPGFWKTAPQGLCFGLQSSSYTGNQHLSCPIFTSVCSRLKKVASPLILSNHFWVRLSEVAPPPLPSFQPARKRVLNHVILCASSPVMHLVLECSEVNRQQDSQQNLESHCIEQVEHI